MDKNIIYVEENDEAPFVFLYGQMLRNAIVTVRPNSRDYQELGEGKIIAVRLPECDYIFEDIRRTCIDFEVRYISFADYYHLKTEDDFERKIQTGEL